MKSGIGAMVVAVAVLVAGGLHALSLEELSATVGGMSEVRAAELAVAQAQADLELARYPGDITFGITPSASVAPSASPISAEISGTASVLVPLGVPLTKSGAPAAAEAGLKAAERSLETAWDDAYHRLVTLYTTAWLAQEEISVLSLGRSAAQRRLAETQSLFDSGSASASMVTAAETELSKRNAAVQQGTLAARLSWLELAYAAGFPPLPAQSLEPPPDLDLRLPPPPQLTEWAESLDAVVVGQRDKIERLQAEREDSTREPVVSSIKTTVSANPHSVAVTFNPATLNLSGSYSFPVWSSADASAASGAGAAPTNWSVGVAVGLSISTAGTDARVDAVLESQIQAETARLDLLLESLALQIRSRYQQYVIGREAVASAQAALTQAQSTLELVARQREENRVTAADLTDAESRQARAEFALREAQAKQQLAALNVASAASYISQLVEREQ